MNLQDLINKTQAFFKTQKINEERLTNIHKEIEKLNKEKDSIPPDFLSDNWIHDIGVRAILECCENCTQLEDQINNTGNCVKCRYNYDSYFEENKNEN